MGSKTQSGGRRGKGNGRGGQRQVANNEQVLAGLVPTSHYIPQPFDHSSSQDYGGTHHYTLKSFNPSTLQGYHSSQQQTPYDMLALNAYVWNSQMLENMPNDGNIIDNDQEWAIGYGNTYLMVPMTNDTSQPPLFTSSLSNPAPFYEYNTHGAPASDQQLLPHNIPSSSSNQAAFYEYNPHGITASNQQPLPHNVPSSSSTLQPSHVPPIHQDIPSNQLQLSSFIGS